MDASTPVLEAVPIDRTPDSGPIHRGGPFAYFVALSCGLTALGAAIILHRQGQILWAGICLLVLGTFAVRAGWCLAERLRNHDARLRSHAVLTDALGFRIHCTCRDVAATVFLDPDKLASGAPTRLLCFLENYASRQRLAHLRIGPHHGLGLPQPHSVALRLAAGQAVVYVLPLVLTAAIASGDHDIPVTMRVRKPTGTGIRLAGTRRHLYDLWTVHFAAPFTVTEPILDAVMPSSVASAGAARFLSLASVSESEPRLDALEPALVANRPADRV